MPTPATTDPVYYTLDSYRTLDSFVYQMNQVRTGFGMDLDAQLAALDITATQLAILKAVADRRGDTGAELSRIYGYDPGALTRMLDRLEQKGLIRRDRSQQDRRCVHLVVTESGLALMEQCLPYLVNLHNHLLRDFSPAEFQTLMGFLARLLNNAGVGTGAAAPSAPTPEAQP